MLLYFYFSFHPPHPPHFHLSLTRYCLIFIIIIYMIVYDVIMSLFYVADI